MSLVSFAFVLSFIIFIKSGIESSYIEIFSIIHSLFSYFKLEPSKSLLGRFFSKIFTKTNSISLVELFSSKRSLYIFSDILPTKSPLLKFLKTIFLLCIISFSSIFFSSLFHYIRKKELCKTALFYYLFFILFKKLNLSIVNFH